ncbi:MAG: hypothetical protein PHU24_11740 [Sphaerochaetaceae bacterium]|nr:hypothetical protein [Sphaerochaetaceae bacterium]
MAEERKELEKIVRSGTVQANKRPSVQTISFPLLRLKGESS